MLCRVSTYPFRHIMGSLLMSYFPCFSIRCELRELPESRHEFNKVLAGEPARRPLDKTALLGQGLQWVGGKHVREFPFDFGGNVRKLSWSLHGDVPFLGRDWRLEASNGGPHDRQKTKQQRLKIYSFVSLMQMGCAPWPCSTPCIDAGFSVIVLSS